MGDGERDENIEAVLDHAAEELPGGHRREVQRAPGDGVALQPALDAAVDVVEEDGERAGPPAPQAAEKRGQEKEREA